MHFYCYDPHRRSGSKLLISSFSKADQQKRDTDGLNLRHGLQGLAPKLCSVSL